MLIARGEGNWRSFCQCNVERDYPENNERRLNLAGVPVGTKPRTFANFIKRPGTEEAHEKCQQIAAGTAPFHILTLVGPTGTGKSHLLEAIARVCVESKVSVFLVPLAELLDTLQKLLLDPDKSGLITMMAFLNGCRVLLLDDVGQQRRTDWRIEQLETIVDTRWRTGLRLVVATNKSYDEIAEGISHRVASRLFDRYSGATATVILTCDDYRIFGPSADATERAQFQDGGDVVDEGGR